MLQLVFLLNIKLLLPNIKLLSRFQSIIKFNQFKYMIGDFRIKNAIEIDLPPP